MPNNKKKKNHRGNKANAQRRSGAVPSPQTLKQAPATAAPSRVDNCGRMGEKEAQKLYKLLRVLAALALPKINAERTEVNRSPLAWDDHDFSNNSAESREIMFSYILEEIEWLVDQLENHSNGRQEALIRSILGRRLTAADKMQIVSWRMHVMDDFFVVGHLLHQGMVLAQIGRFKDQQPAGFQSMILEEDFHEPRLFVVQGLANPLQGMMSHANANFQQAHPSICTKHPEFSSTLAMVRTTLLPYQDGISYGTTVKSVSLGESHHYSNPRDLAKAVNIAVSAYKAAFLESSGGSETADFTLYRCLDVEKDASVKRLTKTVPGLGVPIKFSRTDSLFGEKVEDDGDPIVCTMGAQLANHGGPTTHIMVVGQMIWKPSSQPNDPNFSRVMEKATNTGPSFQLKKEAFCWEGITTAISQHLEIHDSDPCPVHKEYGVTSPTFADCCKQSYLLTEQKAQQKGRVGKLCFQYEPVEEEELERIYMCHTPSSETVDVAGHIRIGSMDQGYVRITIDVPETNATVVKERMDTSEWFHCVKEYSWIYFGRLPLRKRLGFKIFGEVSLDPATGIFEAHGMTARRLTNLIKDMKHMCTGIPVAAASLVMTPPYKIKSDAVWFETNKNLLQQGWDHIEITASIDKEVSVYGLKCAFCGICERDMEDGCKLMRCACKQVFYCSKKHQRKHWVDHKQVCQESRGVSS